MSNFKEFFSKFGVHVVYWLAIGSLLLGILYQRLQIELANSFIRYLLLMRGSSIH